MRERGRETERDCRKLSFGSVIRFSCKSVLGRKFNNSCRIFYPHNHFKLVTTSHFVPTCNIIDVIIRMAKAWTANDRLSIIWKSDPLNKIKRDLFLAVVVTVVLYGCTIWMLTKCMEKKLVVNYTRMLFRTDPEIRTPQNSWCTIT